MSRSLYTIQDLLSWAQQILSEYSIANPRLDSRLLIGCALERPQEYIIAFPEQNVNKKQKIAFESMIHRRCQSEPVSRIIGKREFWGLEFYLSSATLDPRPDSETLIEAVIETIENLQKPLRILDLGTGTGCLLLSLLSELPNASGIGIDIAFEAIHTARKNAAFHHLNDRAKFTCNNWVDGIQEKFDWIISNPPYIPQSDILSLAPEVRLYDPLQALEGGTDGLSCYRELAQTLRARLNGDGHLALEIGQGQEDDVQAIFSNNGFENLRWVKDLSGITRCGIFKLT